MQKKSEAVIKKMIELQAQLDEENINEQTKQDIEAKKRAYIALVNENARFILQSRL